MESNRLDWENSSDCHAANHASASHPRVSNLSGSGLAAAANEGAYNKPDSTDGWKKCLDIMDENDSSMLSGWKDELNNLLVFVCPPSRVSESPIHLSREFSQVSSRPL